MKIGIIREGKQPPDMRVPFSPKQCVQIKKRFPNVEVFVQTSKIRCFSDEEYRRAGIPVVEQLDHCDILFGIKEVQFADLIPGKTYFFFSHTIKEQAYNQKLLQEIVRKNIRLVDYEALTDSQGKRIIGFGYFAGLVGAYNGLLTLGKRYRLFDLKPAHKCNDLCEMKQQLADIQLPPVKIAITGGDGRVAGGAIELLNEIYVKQISIDDFLSNNIFAEPVFVQLHVKDYNTHKKKSSFDMMHFYHNPKAYQGNFSRFCNQTDLLIAAAYWDTNAPVLFSDEDMQQSDFRIKIIADITCDIEGSIPSTIRASTIADPVYDYNPLTGKEELAFSAERNISVMAVDNLPCELPKDASIDFGNNLIKKVLPHLLGNDDEGIVKRASVTENGSLTSNYSYLENYLKRKE